MAEFKAIPRPETQWGCHSGKRVDPMACIEGVGLNNNKLRGHVPPRILKLRSCQYNCSNRWNEGSQNLFRLSELLHSILCYILHEFIQALHPEIGFRIMHE
jgi:hypothetical protein